MAFGTSVSRQLPSAFAKIGDESQREKPAQGGLSRIVTAKRYGGMPWSDGAGEA